MWTGSVNLGAAADAAEKEKTDARRQNVEVRMNPRGHGKAVATEKEAAARGDFDGGSVGAIEMRQQPFMTTYRSRGTYSHGMHRLVREISPTL